VQAIKELSSFFNTVRQSIFHFKPNGFDSRKASAEGVDQKISPSVFAKENSSLVRGSQNELPVIRNAVRVIL